jgi:phospholipid/cholesterol/gamma-HCH transport system substrate-binding protein
MIIKRGVWIQLIIFALITVLGISYTLVHYIGVGRTLFGSGYTAYVDLPDSGGAFSGGEVTYRGVKVGRVGPIKLTGNGVRIELDLDKGHRIPRDTFAVVANRSAVGEQYIDLQPRTSKGPYLDQGPAYTIPRQNTRIPVSTAELLRNLDALVGSVKPDDLSTIVNELDKAFAGAGADLQTILDSSQKILKTANDNYDTTSQLLDNSKTVLNTQRDKGSEIKAFAASLASLTDQIRKSDPAIRTDINAVLPAVTQGNKLIDQIGPTLPVLLSNLTVTGQVIAQRIDGLRSLLILYPGTLAGAFTVTPGDGTEHFGLVLNVDAPAPCTSGYKKTMRYPQDTSNPLAKKIYSCDLPHNSQQVVRGARNAPAPKPGPSLPAGATDAAGSPPSSSSAASAASSSAESKSSVSASSVAPYTADSANSVYVTTYDPQTGAFTGPDGKKYTAATTGGQQRLLGDASWKWLLLGPLAR